MPLIICPHCDNHSSVPLEGIGRRYRCPACRKPMIAEDAERPPTQLRDVGRWFVSVFWSLCLFGVLGVLYSYWTRAGNAENIMQQAFIGVDTCVMLVAIYVGTRALTSAIRS